MKKYVIIATAMLLGAASTASAYNLKRDGWSWASSSICDAEGTDITGLDGIHDGSAYTCWHSNYHAAAGSPERSHPHWVQIDRGDDRSEFTGLAYLPRQSTPNQACTSYYIYVSDTDMSSTPATTAYDIITALGTPTLTGSWAGDITEKYARLEKASTARYILFVNLASLNSSSAACAEMNLFYGTPEGDISNPETDEYNAIRITPVKAGAEPHRIATLDGSLSMSMSFGYVRLSNSDITIEYAPEEVAKFNFEHYDFADDEVYSGDKKDVLTSKFDLTVRPRAGTVESLDEVSIIIAASRNARVNPEATAPIKVTCGGEIFLSVDPAALAGFATETGYSFSGIGATAPGEYVLAIPANLFIAADGSRSSGVYREWTIAGQDAIGEITSDCPTLTFAISGGILTVGGIDAGDSAMLYDAAGRLRASATANDAGRVNISVSSLTPGVYLLNVNNITLKIVI